MAVQAGAAAAIGSGQDVLGSVLFCLSLNHKQMSMYYAPAFFAHLLGKCLQRRSMAGKVDPGGFLYALFFYSVGRLQACMSSCKEASQIMCMQVGAVARLGLAVAATFTVVWAPFLGAPGGALAVLQRLVPLRRGLFEDYVANFWCATSPLVKWKRLLSQQVCCSGADSRPLHHGR